MWRADTGMEAYGVQFPFPRLEIPHDRSDGVGGMKDFGVDSGASRRIPNDMQRLDVPDPSYMTRWILVQTW